MAVEFECVCGEILTAASAHGGLMARCHGCGEVLTVPEAAEPIAAEAPEGEMVSVDPDGHPGEPAAPAVSDAAASDAEVPADHLCAYCGKAAEMADRVACIRCRAVYHAACFERLGRCTVPTCRAAREARSRVLAAPAAAAQQKPCPVCGQSIPLRAQRCRHCGEFVDLAMRRAAKRKRPTKTSYLGGAGLLVALTANLLLAALGDPDVLAWLILMPAASTAMTAWALRDIRRSEGEKTGHWAVGFAFGLSANAVLVWLFRMFVG